MGTFCEYNMWKTNILSAIEKTFGRRSECEQDLFYIRMCGSGCWMVLLQFSLSSNRNERNSIDLNLR